MWNRPFLALCASFMCTFSFAQSWPAQPIKFIVPLAAGGPTDALARIVARQLSTSLGQPVVVENVPGAAGSIGLDRLSKAKPDGYTIGISANSLQAIAPHLSKLPYDTFKGFTPIGGLTSFPYVLIVSPGSPVSSVDDLIKRAKAAPGKISAGTAGVGTGAHVTTAFLSQRTGAEFNVVSYKGSAPVMTDLMGGHVDFTFEVIGTAIPSIEAGRVKAIATTGPKRHPMLGSTPTMAESVPGFEFLNWYAVFGPAGMPPEVVRRLSDEMKAVHLAPEFRTFVDKHGYETMDASSAELATRLEGEIAKWGEVISRMPKTN